MPVTPANRFITRARDADDAATAFGVSRTLFVDPTSHSSSSAARGRSDLSYQTYALARAAWMPGDTLILRPELYIAAMPMPSYTRTIAASGVPGLSRTSGVVTCTLTASHTIPVGCPIYVSGATNSAFDGQFTVLSVTSTTLTWFQYGGDGTTGGGSVTAVGYVRLEPGAMVDVNVNSVTNALGAFYSTAKTFTVLSGYGDIRAKQGYGITLSTTTDSILEIDGIRDVDAYGNNDGCPGLYASGARTHVIIRNVRKIRSERYDGVWMDGDARCEIRNFSSIEAGDDAIELSTTQGCQFDGGEIVSYSDRWQGTGSGTDTSACDMQTPTAGQQHYIKANLVKTVGSVDNLGAINGVRIQASGGAGNIIYDVRRTICHGGPVIWSGGGTASFVNGQFVSTYTGTGDAESGQSGYALYTEGGVLRFQGECQLVASSAVTTSTFSFSENTIAGPCRFNKATHANVILPNGVLDTEIS